MKNQTLVKAFADFAEASKFFEAPFSKAQMFQLITAIGYAEDKQNPNTDLMFALLEAIGVDGYSHNAKDCIEGNVY